MKYTFAGKTGLFVGVGALDDPYADSGILQGIYIAAQQFFIAPQAHRRLAFPRGKPGCCAEFAAQPYHTSAKIRLRAKQKKSVPISGTLFGAFFAFLSVGVEKLVAHDDVDLRRNVLILALDKLQKSRIQQIVGKKELLCAKVGNANEHDSVKVQPSEPDLASLNLRNGDAGKAGHISKLSLSEIEELANFRKVRRKFFAKALLLFF